MKTLYLLALLAEPATKDDVWLVGVWIVITVFLTTMFTWADLRGIKKRLK